MDNNIIVLNENQLEDVIYKTVSRCLDERIVNSLVNSQSDNDGFYNYPTLWRIEKAGILQSQKVGRKNLYSKQEVNQLIKSGKLAKYNHIK